MSDTDGLEPKIHVDDDWKAQAQAEKQKLVEEVGQQPEGAGPGQIPPADFQTLVSTIVTQALMYMGAIPDPYSGQRLLHLDLSRHHIDTLAILEEKTKGNLTEEEATTLTQSLAELRQVFVQLSQQVAAQSGDLVAAAKAKKEAEAQSAGSSDEAKPAGGGIHLP